MSDRKRIVVSKLRGLAIVRFSDRKIIGKVVDAVGEEVLSVIEKDDCQGLLLDFAGVEFISSALLNTLIVLGQRVRGTQGKLRLYNLRAEIMELFLLTRLNHVFDIKNTEAEALETFGACS